MAKIGMVDQLDPGILPVVKLMNKNGHRTTASCEGGEGHSTEYPWVFVVVEKPEQVVAQMHSLGSLLMDNMICGFTIGYEQVYHEYDEDGKHLFEYLHVKFFGPETLEEFNSPEAAVEREAKKMDEVIENHENLDLSSGLPKPGP